jgi:hypothetical protein
MLRPIMRLALAQGLKYQDVDTLIRELMLDEATQTWEKTHSKAPSGSQLSVTTGINRKEIKRRAEWSSEQRLVAKTHKSIAAQVFARWRFLAQTGELSRQLPLDSILPDEKTFAYLVRQTGSDVHYRSVLDELARLKLVVEAAGVVDLVAQTFVPPGSSPEMLSMCADNSAAHMSAAIHNATGGSDPFLERAVWGDGISAADCKVIEALARELWADTRTKLYEAILRAPEAPTIADRHSVRIGTYVYFE